MICYNCQSDEIHTDSARGSAYCGQCGMVQEENMVVSALQFDSTSAKSTMHGKIVSMDNKNIGTNFVDSSYHIKNTISSICIKLSLSNDHVMRAFQWYKLCLQHSLSKGKSILYTLCACIYITCREDSTPHLLIDFSNELRIDMFKIGRVFLKLQHILGLDIAPTDMSLYMHRFMAQLHFKQHEILDFSVRLVSRMKKDWILTGRRPNNLCGAALLIASRIYGENKDITEIARVVHASVSTITKRLQEIGETESANLKIEEFKSKWLETEENPPVAKMKRKRLKVEKQEEKTETIEKEIYPTPGESEESENNEFNYDELMLGEEEIKKKKQIWEALYGDYVIQQENKRKQRPTNVPVRKRSNKHGFKTMEEAFCGLNQKVSSKLNYKALLGLFDSS